MKAGTLDLLWCELARILQPLSELLQGGNVDAFFARLGLRPPPGISELEQLAGMLNDVANAAAGLPAPLAQLAAAIAANDLAAIMAAGPALFDGVRTVLRALPELAEVLKSVAAVREGLTNEQREAFAVFTEVLPRRLLDYLFIQYLEDRAPGLTRFLELLALLDRTIEPGVLNDAMRPSYLRRTLHLDRIAGLITDPQQYLHEAYGWGEPVFDSVELFRRLEAYLSALEKPAALIQAEGQPAILDMLAVSLRAQPDEAPNGIELRLRLAGSSGGEYTYPVGKGGTWRLRTASSNQISAGLRGVLRPPLHITLSAEGSLDVNVEIGVQGGTDAAPVLLLGKAGGSRIEARKVSVVLGVHAHADTGAQASVEPSVRAELIGGMFKLDFAQADGFLRALFSKVNQEIGFEVAATWRPSTGLRWEGGVGTEVKLPARLVLGPVRVEDLVLLLGASANAGLQVAAGASLNAQLGPLRISVDRVGMIGELTFPGDGQGNLGPANLALRFLAPRGVGLAMEASPITGGGFLSIDEEKGQYAGAVQLEFKGIALKAIGIITTRMPDNSNGFSLLLIISSEFTPIQLGYGFTLSGVGGLVGVNRTAMVDVLRAGIKARTLDSIMFPRDPVANASQLISNLSAVFPPAPGRFVFGPMARIGWGVPKTLLTLDLGLIVELPPPIRIIVLGRLRMALPHEEAAIVTINMDVLGVIDFERGEASVDATLYDSAIAGFALTGDMAMRMSWGDRPGFALAAGGFHPRFQPPPGFPVLERLALTLCTGDNPRLRLESYLALTSNTAQFGARLELYAAAFDFSIEGVLAFDSLFQFEPFLLSIETSGLVALKQGARKIMSITAHVTLTGPSPWHARGYARFEFLGIPAEIPFEVSIGTTTAPTIPAPVEVEQLVEAALKDPRSWSTQLPPEGESLVSVREIPRAEGELLIHPLATLSVTQRVAPLDRELQRFGSARISGPTHMKIVRLRVGGVDMLDSSEPIQEHFAPAQFLDLSDDEKLSQPSFERWEGGRRLGRPGLSYDTAQPFEATLDPETIIIDEPDGSTSIAPEVASTFAMPEKTTSMTMLRRFAASSAAAHAKTRMTGPGRFRGPALGLEVAE